MPLKSTVAGDSGKSTRGSDLDGKGCFKVTEVLLPIHLHRRNSYTSSITWGEHGQWINRSWWTIMCLWTEGLKIYALGQPCFNAVISGWWHYPSVIRKQKVLISYDVYPELGVAHTLMACWQLQQLIYKKKKMSDQGAPIFIKASRSCLTHLYTCSLLSQSNSFSSFPVPATYLVLERDHIYFKLNNI